MKAPILKYFVNQLKGSGKSLSKSAFLVGHPWALIDDDKEVQKLIFKANGELILSKNGAVIYGKWEYLPSANSLIIDRGADKILCKEAFIEDGVLILKKDGTNMDFFALANENIIPDLNILRYLEELRRKKLGIYSLKLLSGEYLEIQTKYSSGQRYLNTPGNIVTSKMSSAPDGFHKLAKRKDFFRIKDGKLIGIYRKHDYDFSDHISVFQKADMIKVHDSVIVANDPIYSGIQQLSAVLSIRIEKGEIKELIFTSFIFLIFEEMKNLFKKDYREDYNLYYSGSKW